MRAVWDLLPSDIDELGYERDASHLFGRFQRVSTWRDGPDLSRLGRALVHAHGLDVRLPEIVSETVSRDGSTRLVLSLPDRALGREGASDRIEAVHMPRSLVPSPLGAARERVTMCLSTQVGCAMGCTFCRTATMGLSRHLAAHEIIGQLLLLMHRYGPRSSEQLNIVFMGMGEPLHNVDALIRTLDVICHPAGLGVAPSRITVSTAGHVAGLERLAAAVSKTRAPELAVSVNGASSASRLRLMPIERRWPLPVLRKALDAWPLRPHQKITLEYVLLAGVNDDDASARGLADWIGDLRHVVNVIPFNEWTGSTFREPSRERVDRFVTLLRERGCLVKVRTSRGRDVRAACGMLAVSSAPA